MSGDKLPPGCTPEVLGGDLHSVKNASGEHYLVDGQGDAEYFVSADHANIAAWRVYLQVHGMNEDGQEQRERALAFVKTIAAKGECTEFDARENADEFWDLVRIAKGIATDG